MNIFIKLTVLISVFIIIPMGTVGLVSFNSSKKNLEQVRLQQLEAIADLKREKIIAFFDSLKADVGITQDYYNIKANLPIVSKFISNRENPSYVKAKEMLDGQLNAWAENKPELVDLMLVNLAGKIVYTNNPEHEHLDLGYPLPDPGNMAFSKGLEGIYITDIFRNERETNRFTMIVSAPAYDFNNQLIGVIAFQIYMENIFGFIQDTTGLGKTGETLIGRNLGDRALFLNPLRHDKDAALKRTALFGAKSAFPIQEAVSGRDGAGKSVDYRDEDIIAVWRHIPSLNWGLVAKIDRAEAFESIAKTQDRLTAFAVLTMLIGILATLTISSSFTTPIRLLQEAIDKIKEGDFSIRSDIESRNEIGALASGINSMAESLGKREAALKAANINILKSEKSLAEAQKLAKIGSWELDIVKNKLWWSDEEYKIFNIDKSKFGTSYEAFLDALHPEDKKYVDDAYKDSLINKNPYNIEHRLLLKDGTVKHVNERCETFYDKDGNPLRSIGTTQDITERKKSDQILLHSAKLASIGEMAANVAHEINNPMTVIMLNASLMLEEMDKDDKFYNEVQWIDQASLRVKEIVKNLLNFSRHRKTRKQKSDVNELVKESLDLIKSIVNISNITVDTNYGTNIPNIDIDPNHIKQVLINLISNACHAMQNNGRLVLKTELKDKEVIISVKDSGVGMSEAMLKNIFESFFTTKGEEGTGLGLSISYGIVKNHGGDILVQSEEGVGTEFKVILPI